MKKEYVLASMISLAAVLLPAAGANAGLVVDIDPSSFSQGQDALTTPLAERLAAVSENLEAAVGGGGHAPAGALLASMYAGSAVNASVAPVYTAGRAADAMPAAAATAVTRLPPGVFKSAEPPEPVLAAADASAEASAASAANDTEKEEEKEDEEKPQPKLWETALAFAIGMAFVLLIICLL